mgnify:CR=1 FL=1
MFSQLKSLDELNRRSMLEYAARTMLGVTVLPGALAFGADEKKEEKKKGEAKKSSGSKPNSPGGTAKHVIFLFMAGGPSQLELFDNKPKLRELDGKTIPAEFTKGKRYPVAPDSAVAYARLRREIHEGWCYFWASRTKPEKVLR